MNIRIIALAVVMTASAFAQTTSSGAQVILSDGPPRDFYTRYFYTSGNDTFTCIASSQQAVAYTFALTSTVGGVTTSLVFSAGHGIHADAKPVVTVSGGTGAWAGVNGTHAATYTSTTALSIPIDSSGYGAVAGTLVVNAFGPRLTQPIWAVSRVRAATTPSSYIWSTAGWNSICSNYATLSYQ